MVQQSKKISPTLQLAFLIVLFFGSVAFCALLYYVIAKYAMGISNPLQYAQSGNTSGSPEKILFANGMISSIGCFLLPALLFGAVVHRDIKNYFCLKKIFSLQQWAIVTVIMICSTAVVSLLVEWNKAIPLPDSLLSLREAGKVAEELINSFFVTIDFSRFLVLSLFIALLPAVSEEFFFRGVLLRIFSAYKGGIGFAIFLSSIVFALFHLTFDNLLGILFMGAVLGCIYWFTQNLWLNIWAHFLNNFLIVVMKSMYATKMVQNDWSAVETVPLWFSILAAVLTFGGLYLLAKNGETNEIAHTTV